VDEAFRAWDLPCRSEGLSSLVRSSKRRVPRARQLAHSVRAGLEKCLSRSPALATCFDAEGPRRQRWEFPKSSGPGLPGFPEVGPAALGESPLMQRFQSETRPRDPPAKDTMKKVPKLGRICGGSFSVNGSIRGIENGRQALAGPKG
jgi:hypothetical protein